MGCLSQTANENQINQLRNTNTDWNDILFRNALTQEYNIGISGGGDKSDYYTSDTVPTARPNTPKYWQSFRCAERFPVGRQRRKIRKISRFCSKVFVLFQLKKRRMCWAPAARASPRH